MVSAFEVQVAINYCHKEFYLKCYRGPRSASKSYGEIYNNKISIIIFSKHGSHLERKRPIRSNPKYSKARNATHNFEF